MQKSGKAKVAALMREQYKLQKAEILVTNLITKISEHINKLKVEELQLKANSVQIELNRAELDHAVAIPSTSYNYEETTGNINQQELDLDVFTTAVFKMDEETESD